VLVGSGNDTARRLNACAGAAFRASLAVAKAGNRVNEIGRVVERRVPSSMIDELTIWLNYRWSMYCLIVGAIETTQYGMGSMMKQ
jgi:hypothetical protein